LESVFLCTERLRRVSRITVAIHSVGTVAASNKATACSAVAPLSDYGLCFIRRSSNSPSLTPGVFAVLLFSSKEKRRKEAQVNLTKIINQHCPAHGGAHIDERGEWRVNATLPVYVVPIQNNVPDVAAAFASVTKEISSSGLCVVMTRRLEVREVMVAVKSDDLVCYFRGEVRHQGPLGAGLFQCGVQIAESVPSGEYPQLASLVF
jgi:hypothetical protein